jgi:hypothetical protein
MTKAELIERIVDAMIDPWTDNPDDYLDSTPIDIYGAMDLYNQIRFDEASADLEPDERMPEEATPALVMEAYNCLIRARKHEARVARLAEFITDNDCVCEYANYYYPTHDDAVDIIPTDFITGTDKFPFAMHGNNTASVLDMLFIGKNSAEAGTFDPNLEYCWFDADKMILHSTDAPFSDGTLDAEAFAAFALDDAETLGYFLDGVMDDNDIKYVFGCTKEELINE